MSLSARLEFDDVRGEPGVHEQGPSARLGMGVHHRMDHRLQCGDRPALPLTLTHGVERGLKLRLPVVDRGQRGEESLQGRAQVREGGHLVGKERVTTGRRDHDRPEDRPERRALHESHVRVPVEPLACGDVAVVGVDGPGPGVVDLEHVGGVGQTRDHRVALGQLAEPGGEGLVAVRVEVLVGEEDHPSLEPDLSHRGHRGVVEVAEVEAVDDGADRAGQGGHVEFDVGAEDAALHRPNVYKSDWISQDWIPCCSLVSGTRTRALLDWRR